MSTKRKQAHGNPKGPRSQMIMTEVDEPEDVYTSKDARLGVTNVDIMIDAIRLNPLMNDLGPNGRLAEMVHRRARLVQAFEVAKVMGF